MHHTIFSTKQISNNMHDSNSNRAAQQPESLQQPRTPQQEVCQQESTQRQLSQGQLPLERLPPNEQRARPPQLPDSYKQNPPPAVRQFLQRAFEEFTQQHAQQDFQKPQSPTDTESSAEFSDDEQDKRNTMHDERRRVQATIQQFFANENLPPARLDALIDMVMEKEQALKDANQEIRKRQYENSGIRLQLDDVTHSNNALYNETSECRQTISNMAEAMRALNKKKDQAADEDVSADKIRIVHEAEQNLQEQLKQRNQRVEDLKRQLEKANQAIEDEKARAGPNWNLHTSHEWAGNLQRFMGFITNDNLALRSQLSEMNKFLAAARSADAARYQRITGSQSQGTGRLTYGTVDRGMDDAFDEDQPMKSKPARYVSPSGVRVRRRVARTKAPTKRLAASAPSKRPADCKNTHSERRAASTYLQYRTKPNQDVLKPVGRSGPSGAPRKRPRLSKASEMLKRLEHECGLREGLPPIPHTLMPERISPNPYDMRNDESLAKSAELWSLDDEPPRSQPEVLPQVKLVTVPGTKDFYTERRKEFKRPRYLPKEPRPVSSDQRRHWAKVANQWSLGPEKKIQPKKQVRFANKVEYEPAEPEPRPAPRRREEPSFNWSSLIIAILLFLLVVTNLGPANVFSWEDANEPPHDIAAMLRSPRSGEGTFAKFDYEVAKWSDIDASVFG